MGLVLPAGGCWHHLSGQWTSCWTNNSAGGQTFITNGLWYRCSICKWIYSDPTMLGCLLSTIHYLYCQQTLLPSRHLTEHAYFLRSLLPNLILIFALISLRRLIAAGNQVVLLWGDCRPTHPVTFISSSFSSTQRFESAETESGCFGGPQSLTFQAGLWVSSASSSPSSFAFSFLWSSAAGQFESR